MPALPGALLLHAGPIEPVHGVIVIAGLLAIVYVLAEVISSLQQ